MIKKHSRKWIIGAIVAGISMAHFFPLPGWLGTHWLHREVYFFPILLAGLWHGAKGGVITATVISIIYTIKFALSNLLPDIFAAVGFQVAVFVSVGLFFGWMVDRQERRRKERDTIKDAFGRYVPMAVRDEILSGRISLEGEFKTVTVLFADLRNFTDLVEQYDPRIVVRMLNRYFEEMTEAILEHDGLVLQFIGDEIEAIFGAPLPMDDHARMALNAAVAMRTRLEKLNKAFVRKGLPPLSHGIGIHTGSVLAGNIGSPDRQSYAMVGTTVNLASRIQAANKRFGTDILVTVDTARASKNNCKLSRLTAMRFKGYSRPIDLYSVNGCDGVHPDMEIAAA